MLRTHWKPLSLVLAAIVVVAALGVGAAFAAPAAQTTSTATDYHQVFLSKLAQNLGTLYCETRHRLVEWLAWMDLEIDNIRRVLRRCLNQGDFQHGIDLATALGWYWITRASTEGARLLDQLLASGTSNLPAHAWAYFIRGFLAVLQSNPLAARP